VTGRSLHDALLRALVSAEVRAALAEGAPGARAAGLGAEETAVLAAADAARLRRLARFFGRHFYRERIVRLYAAGRRLARAVGPDPLTLLAEAAFTALLDAAELGSAATAVRVAARVEARLGPALARHAWGVDLLRYEGALFRAEAGPRRWGVAPPAAGAPARAAAARVVALAWDVTPVVLAVRRGDRTLPVPREGATRLLVALAPDGRVSAVRCADAVARLWDALDGARAADELAALVGVPETDVRRTLGQLADLGAVTGGADA
jgi:hypothetical protein